jgi:hypothetical protein
MFRFFDRKKNSANKQEYLFKDHPDTACFVCDHVLNLQRPILYAAHDESDGSWQFLCGGTDHTEEQVRIISLLQATKLDASINGLVELAVGFSAERTGQQDKWVTFSSQ